MKILKNIKLLCAVFCMTALYSCDKYLDIQPVGKVIPRTAKEFRALLTQAYSSVPADRGLATFRSDEMIMDGTLAAEDLNSYKDIWTWNDVSPSENTAAFKWRQFYHTLFIANYVIESKDRIEEGTMDEVNQLVGESYMLRAYMHFLLVNLHGEPYTHCDPATSKAIPLKLDSDTEATLSRNTVGEVYNSVLSDLTEAEKYLNVDKWDLGYNYRFNTLSVNAIRSRVYLYMGEWAKSLEASQAVLDVKHDLEDMATSTVLPNEYNSSENILALEQVMTSAYVRAAKVNTTLWRMYTSSDLRRSKYYDQRTPSNILVVKGGSNQYACSFRVGEMYLNAAEAALMTGEAAINIARKNLLTLMEKRYTANGYAAKETAVNAMDRDELLQEIYNERTRELAFEGHRWFDLRRTTRPRLEKTFGGTSYVLEENDSRYTIRIPSEAIEANPGLAN
ncbi:MAG: RagB/SusD family nutrient uptake outer membrane protein [Bacteroides nordii]